MQSITSIDEVFALLRTGGETAYFGEPVSVLEHSLQTAWFAKKHGGDDALVAAALLHDLGHLLHSEGEDAAERGLDTRHEDLAAEILTQHLPNSVLDPIRLHVAAKRYLCHAEPQYLIALSTAFFWPFPTQEKPSPCAAPTMRLRSAGSLFQGWRATAPKLHRSGSDAEGSAPDHTWHAITLRPIRKA